MVEIVPYERSKKPAWDSFIASSKNATFLFRRGYMEYHSDRFQDHSLMFTEGGRLIAVLPANRVGPALFSHAGLTYGGIATDDKMKTSKMLELFDALRTYASGARIGKLVYKAVPHIYHRVPAEEDLYALFRCKARLIKREASAALFLPEARVPRKRARVGEKNRKKGLSVQEGADLDAFMEIVKARLMEKHGVAPVHSVEEMRGLMKSFPENIRLFGVYQDGRMVSGALIYESGAVAHAQYLAATEEGRRERAFDMLFPFLISERYRDKRWFDFGTSTLEGGNVLNESLMRQKEEFGASVICYDTYEIETGGSHAP